MAGVSRCWLVPSAFMTQIADSNPALLLPKTMCVPSGEYSGLPLLQTRLVRRVPLT